MIEVPGAVYVLPFWCHPPGYVLVEWLLVGGGRSLGFLLLSRN